MGMIFAFMTGDRVKHGTSGDPDDYTEKHGWVDPTWSRRELFESRNDVAPVMTEPDDAEDLRDLVLSALGQLGACADNGDGTFYSVDGRTDDETGAVWTYALHFERKYLHPERGWVVEDWHPVHDGGLTLDDQ